MLNARDIEEIPPRIRRVVLDPKVTLSPKSNLAQSARELPVFIFADEGFMDGREDALAATGVEVVGVRSVDGSLDLGFILEELGRRGVSGLLVEGGGITASHFMAGGYVDRMTVFYAPKFVGASGLPMLGDLGVGRMSEARGFRVTGTRRFGEDVAVSLYPVESEAGKHIRKGEDVHRIG